MSWKNAIRPIRNTTEMSNVERDTIQAESRDCERSAGYRKYAPRFLSAAPDCGCRSGACAASASGAGNRRFRVYTHTVVRIRIDRLIADTVAVLVHPAERLLK